MSDRKRWASKEEAQKYAVAALQNGNKGLSFWAACDYLGWSIKKVQNYDIFQNALYEDFLMSMGRKCLQEEIDNLEWEINTILHEDRGDSNASKEYLESLQSSLNIAKAELKDLFKYRKGK